jgi:hypothetical protein
MNEDHRHIMTFFLRRSDRPKYWEFHCPYCKAKVCELDGVMVFARDVWLDSSAGPQLTRCPGTDKKWCRYWYNFILEK